MKREFYFLQLLESGNSRLTPRNVNFPLKSQQQRLIYDREMENKEKNNNKKYHMIRRTNDNYKDHQDKCRFFKQLIV